MDFLKEFAISTAIAFFIGLKGSSKSATKKKFKAVALRLFESIRMAYSDDEDFS